jgi:crotonobetaine/carnitine-CoA ligase
MGVGHLCHAIGCAIDVFCPLYWGIRTAISRWFSASQFWETVRANEATIVGCIVGPLMAILCSQPPRAEDSDNPLRVASSATGQIPHDKVVEFEERFGVEVLELYGQTESGALGSIAQRSDDRPYYSQGKPHGWCEVMIGNSDDHPCPPNVEGEILLRPTIAHTFLDAYHNQPDKFAEACRNLWFHTGDIGYLDQNGYLHFKGRFAHSIRRRGENISAFEVEQTILLHSGIEECAVVGVPAQLGEEDVKAYIQLKPTVALAPEEIVRFCEQRIAYFKVPRYIEFVDQFPRSSAKKEIERHKLRERGIGDAWDRVAAGVILQRPD